MAGGYTYTRGANSVNSMFVKPAMRKYCQRKYSSDTMKERAVKNKSPDNNGDGICWVRDDRTGIYYPKGQEKVIEDVPRKAAKDFDINWFNYNNPI